MGQGQGQDQKQRKPLTGVEVDFTYISEINVQAPDVPLLEDINLAELTGGDENPVFVTLPIGLANSKSGNKRFYDDKFVQELEKQVRERRPVGLMGHLAEEKLATEFPSEAVHWVGVLRVGEMLWGKGYFPPGEARERIRRYKATGKKIATSIFAKIDGIWDDAIKSYRMLAETLDLAQIDIAPADRAGIRNLAAVPGITSEMEDNQGDDEDMSKEKDEVIKGLTPEDVSSLPEAVRNKIIEGQMSEMRKTLGLPADVDVSAFLKKMQEAEEARKGKEVQEKITELAKDPEKGIKVDSIRDLVVEMVKVKNPSTVQEAETFYTEIIGSESVKNALKSLVQETMGPRQSTPSGGTREEKKGKFFTIPAVAQD